MLGCGASVVRTTVPNGMPVWVLGCGTLSTGTGRTSLTLLPPGVQVAVTSTEGGSPSSSLSKPTSTVFFCTEKVPTGFEVEGQPSTPIRTGRRGTR